MKTEISGHFQLKNFKVLLKSNGGQITKKWLKTPKVRKMLDMPGTLQTLVMNGTLPYTKIGCVIYFDQDDIQQYSFRKCLNK